MSFFKSAKVLVSASAGAVSRSVELMADLAVRLEHETKILALRAAVSNLELLSQNSEIDPGRDRVQLRKELFEKYDELIALLEPQGKLEFEDRKKSLLSAERLEQEQALSARIAELELRIKKGGYGLPIEEKLALQQLLDNYEQLFTLNERKRTVEFVGRTRQLTRDIEALEARRRRTEEISFPSGRKKSLIRLLDEKKEGVCEYWYESGARKARIDFKAGLAHGRCLTWYESGAPELDALYCDGRLTSPSIVYSSGGVKVIKYMDDFLGLRMWNGVYLGSYRVNANMFVAKFWMLLRVLFSLKAMQGLYRARNGGPDNILLNEWGGVLNNFSAAVGDVSVWVDD